MNQILQKIDQLREEKGLSVFRLTELAGLSENTIYNWYNKGRNPSLSALQAVCKTLDICMMIIS